MFILLLIFSSLTFSTAEYVKNFKITEGVQIGSRIGFIGETEPGRPKPPSPPYLVVPSADSPIDEDLDIDQNTGEVRTNVELDREKRARYRFSAIPLSGEGENIKVFLLIGIILSFRIKYELRNKSDIFMHLELSFLHLISYKIHDLIKFFNI